jgi:hypothetical protein
LPLLELPLLPVVVAAPLASAVLCLWRTLLLRLLLVEGAASDDVDEDDAEKPKTLELDVARGIPIAEDTDEGDRSPGAKPWPPSLPVYAVEANVSGKGGNMAEVDGNEQLVVL